MLSFGVCLSVCHKMEFYQTVKISLHKQLRTIAQELQFTDAQNVGDIPVGLSPTEEYTWGYKNVRLSKNDSLSKIVEDRCRGVLWKWSRKSYTLYRMMMMIVDLYSALRKVPLLRYMSRCVVKRNVFSADRKDPMLSDGSRRWSGRMFQTIGPATENVRRPNLLQRWRGIISWWWVADRRRRRLSMSGVGMQRSIRYCGAMPCKHRWTMTPNLYWTRWGTSNQCSPE